MSQEPLQERCVVLKCKKTEKPIYDLTDDLITEISLNKPLGRAEFPSKLALPLNCSALGCPASRPPAQIAISNPNKAL
jgi:hypothetical protein